MLLMMQKIQRTGEDLIWRQGAFRGGRKSRNWSFLKQNNDFRGCFKKWQSEVWYNKNNLIVSGMSGTPEPSENYFY